MQSSRTSVTLGLALMLLLSSGGTHSAVAGEVGAFVGLGHPWETWSGVLGASFASTFFDVVSLETEVAQAKGEAEEAKMLSLAVNFLVTPPRGRLVPYGGLSFGVFRQTFQAETDHGTSRALVVGLKLRSKPFFAKAEYQRIHLSGEPLLLLEDRVSIGAGVIF